MRPKCVQRAAKGASPSQQRTLPLTFSRSAGEAGLPQAHSKHPGPVFGPYCPPQFSLPGHSNPIAPTVSQRFSSPSDHEQLSLLLQQLTHSGTLYCALLCTRKGTDNSMISEKQLAANRSNAARSTGPRTEEGKKNSSLNARRHNLTGQVTAMTDADRAAHDRFSAAIIQSLAPEGAMELQFAQRIATDSWRLNRASAIEDNLFALGYSEQPDGENQHPEIHAALGAARTFAAEGKQLQLLTLYEQRINRNLQKNFATLQALQAARKTQRESEMKNAIQLLQLNEKRNLPYEPAKDGFVFSNDEIHAAIDRERRLERARETDFSRHKRKGRCPAPPYGEGTHESGGADATRFARVPQKAHKLHAQAA